MSYTWEDFKEIFNEPKIATPCAQALAAEHLVSIRIAVTINIPPNSKDYKRLDVPAKVNMYKELWRTLCIEYETYRDDYVIEYCKSGEPHLHGTLFFRMHPNIVTYPDREVLRMVAKSIFMKLPRSAYKQFANAKINEYFNIFNTPAVCLKMPQVLSEGWSDYMKKTQ